ncbi:hypothetical protein D9758_015456 [Tetrapyrgos nigripes]|uniref:Uncharacterized protein n=1 Tax=Tetrapyrgos nigripes TaxID=182062 RepID=A0A8H5CNC4_9AGAR|nr:hypothetical protein D9758_015456 [Tetrapyrgos nigripes]
MSIDQSLSHLAERMALSPESSPESSEEDLMYSFDELNERLTLGYMRAHEPWRALPGVYLPDPAIRYHPPKLVFGFGFRWRDLVEFAYCANLAERPEHPEDGGYSSVWLTSVRHLISKSGFDKLRYAPQVHPPVSRHADLVLMLWDNYDPELTHGYPEEGFLIVTVNASDACERVVLDVLQFYTDNFNPGMLSNFSKPTQPYQSINKGEVGSDFFYHLGRAISALAAAGFATAQEAARFGSVNVSPCGFTGGDAITITYNATTAIQHDNVPQSVGLWIQGINVTDGIRTTTTPFFRLAHNDSLNAQADPIFTAQLTLPEIFATFTTQSWQVTSFIIYGNDVLTEFGGTTDTCPQTN